MSSTFIVLWSLSTTAAIIMTVIFASRKSDRKKLVNILVGLWIVSVACFIMSVATTPEKSEPAKTPVTGTKTETPKEEVKPAETKTEEPAPTPTPKYPSLTEETLDKNLVLSCEGGDEVALWDKPTSSAEGARVRDKVPCGTLSWAFNKYYNEGQNKTFYAINTAVGKNAYGWITEDLISWR